MDNHPDRNITRFEVDDDRGSISKQIGTGKHARTNIVYTIIKWSFIAGSLLTLIIIAMVWKNIIIFSVENIVSIWTIFIPLITLSLGYLFGKGKD
jgi:hypothetical protein